MHCYKPDSDFSLESRTQSLDVTRVDTRNDRTAINEIGGHCMSWTERNFSFEERDDVSIWARLVVPELSGAVRV